MTMPTLLMQRAHDEAVGDDAPQLPDKPRRRTFTAEYKLRIVAEYDACVATATRAPCLRREGLYSSHMVEWRRARDNGGGCRSGRSAAGEGEPGHRGVGEGEQADRASRGDLAKHKLALDIAGKAHALLEMLAESATDDTAAARRPKPKR
jgi:transposase